MTDQNKLTDLKKSAKQLARGSRIEIGGAKFDHGSGGIVLLRAA